MVLGVYILLRTRNRVPQTAWVKLMKLSSRGTCPLTMISLRSEHERLQADGGVHRA